MEAKGYKVREKVIFQDNKSTIRIELNGRKFCTGYLMHINIRYLFVKYRVGKH